MKKALLLLAALALLLTMQSSVDTVYAHGGAYRGPAGEVPPGQRDPKDPQPPPENPATPSPNPGGGTGTPPPGQPPSGGDGGDTPDAPPPPPSAPDGPGGNNGPGGIATPGGKKRAAPKMMSFENWLFWWAYNKDEILNLKSRLKNRETNIASGSSGPFLGKGKGGTGTQSATPQMIKSVIVPALESVVDNKDIHPDIRGGALIGLARAEPTKKYLDRFFAISKADSDEDKVVQESAIIALGILQIKEQEVRDHLISLVEDRNYPMRGRCFAMLALGLLQDSSDEVFKALEGRLDGSEVHLDVPVCALLAIGLIGDDKKVPQLVEWLEAGKIGREKLSDLEKAWVVAALGKIGHEDALKPISKVLREKGRYAKRSAAIAIGQIATQVTDEAEQQKYAKMLMQFHKTEGDLTSKNYALTSLGRMGGHANASVKVRDGVKTFLKMQFKEVNKTTERPFVALSMGLLGFDGPDQSPKPQALKEELAAVIRPALEARKGDKTALGALAISLGMLKDQGSVDLLKKILSDRGMDKKLRGASAMALGLIGDQGANDVILTALKEREDRDLRVDTAVAAGLLGSPKAVDELVKVLNDKKASQFVLGSVALALGQIGDSRAIEPMTMILEPQKTNGTYPDLTRALVAVALGQLSDRRDVRVLYRMSKDINYRASVPALDEILTIL
ncbi:MAG: HEAT repeat domain-containing protein [Planctomycetota bacterium]